MKTVKRKAKEYSEPIIYSYSDCRWCDAGELEEYIQDAYIAGYTEATRWRDVNEELPEKINNDEVGVTVLCKTKEYGMVTLMYLFKEKVFYSRITEKHYPLSYVYAWRPIETI